MNKVEDIIHAENVAALVLAILSSEPLSAEDAFARLRNHKAKRMTKTKDVVLLRNAGCSWQEIQEYTGIKHPNYLYWKARHKPKQTLVIR